jgi:hypothetical protein
MATVFNWASVAKGKPQLTVDVEAGVKEKERIAKAAKTEREQMAWEADAPMRMRQTMMLRAKLDKEREQSLARQVQQVEHDRKFSKEGGWLMGQWPTSREVPYEPRLTVPKHVNERARDWVERALASWWQEWEKCETVEALRTAFINAFVPYALEHSNYNKGVYEFKRWEHLAFKAIGANENKEFTHAERYANLLKWVKDIESDKPYWNQLWVACKNITFENCLWAMNVEAQTFRAMDKLCSNTEVSITGFLQVEGQVITWLADFTKYIPYLHDPKPKSKQAIEAIEAKRQRDEERFDRMLLDDYY